MGKKANVLIIEDDDDYLYGLKNDLYPEEIKKIQSGQIEVLGLKEINDRNDISRVGNPGDFYILNPYTQQYELVNNGDTSDVKDVFLKMVEGKSTVLKGFLIRLGAKCIYVENKIGQKNDKSFGGDIKGGKGPAKGSANTNYKKNLIIKVTNILRSADKNREPQTFESCEEYAISHGIGGDPFVKELLERYRDCGVIHGVENKTVEFCKEVKVSLDIAASVSTPSFNVGTNFSFKSDDGESFSLIIHVNFDEVEDL